MQDLLHTHVHAKDAYDLGSSEYDRICEGKYGNPTKRKHKNTTTNDQSRRQDEYYAISEILKQSPYLPKNGHYRASDPRPGLPFWTAETVS